MESQINDDTPIQTPSPSFWEKYSLPILIIANLSLLAICLTLFAYLNKTTSTQFFPPPFLTRKTKLTENSPPPLSIPTTNQTASTTYNVDTDQSNCYNNNTQITCPSKSQPFYGQDAQYNSQAPSYTDNHNGTITDNNTGLMWTKSPGPKTTYQQATNNEKTTTTGDYTDWRLPTIKELYTLINFNGTDPSAVGNETSSLTPFINTNYFDFEYGDPNIGDRIIDSQWITSSIYKGTVMNNQQCFFGVNFADGRIKCYPTSSQKGYFTLYVRGSLPQQTFIDQKNGTILDTSTNLLWQQQDSQKGMSWQSALSYCDSLDLAKHTDWRLPNAKELQSIVDYDRSPDKTSSATIDPLFQSTQITNELNQPDYPFYWTSTTHLNTKNADQAVYVAFGRATGKMNGRWMDVHGAGAQRSDPKTGDPNNFPDGRGPQGDAIRIYNYVRCVTNK